MNWQLLNKYTKCEGLLLVGEADYKIQKKEKYDIALPTSSLLYRYDECSVLHSPNESSAIGINLDLAC